MSGTVDLCRACLDKCREAGLSIGGGPDGQVEVLTVGFHPDRACGVCGETGDVSRYRYTEMDYATVRAHAREHVAAMVADEPAVMPDGTAPRNRHERRAAAALARAAH